MVDSDPLPRRRGAQPRPGLGTGAKAEAGGLSKAASSLSFSLDRIAILDDSTVTFRQEAPGEEYETTYRIDRAFIDDIR